MAETTSALNPPPAAASENVAALPALFARRTPPLQQSIDISCPPGPQQQTCSSGFAAVDPC